VTRVPFESIDAFNDHPATTHATVLTVLQRVREDLSPMSPPTSQYRRSPAPSGWHVFVEILPA
jgi:hypothetical protein